MQKTEVALQIWHPAPVMGVGHETVSTIPLQLCCKEAIASLQQYAEIRKS